MSLLNEMLKDLNVNRSRDRLPFALVVHKKKKFSQWTQYLPFAFLGISVLLFILLFVSHKGKLAPKANEISVLMTDLSQMIGGQAMASIPLAQFNPPILPKPLTTTEWMPSVIVPAPLFAAQTDSTWVADTMTDPFMDENTNSVNKVFTGLSPKEWYNEQFNKALDAIEAGNTHEAVYILELILAKFPDAVDARESLAAIYFSQGENTQASGILEEGLRIQPNALSLNVMKARLLYDQNHSEQALNVLQRFNPDIQDQPDFYGLKAAILQSIGKVNEAGSIYKALIELNPASGQYWLGYGIALENKNAMQQAAAAYKRASESYDSEPEVRSYAEERLKTLQG